VVATIFTFSVGIVLALLTSIVLSSLNQTRPAVVRQHQSDQQT
jgi:MFS superfamily sulfate permease-like transporter